MSSSETPPPVSDDALQQSEIDLNAASTTDVNLDDDTTSAALKKPQVLSDDLFFSAIAEPSAQAEENGKEDMDELFKAHKSEPAIAATKEIKLDDEDVFGAESKPQISPEPVASATTAPATTTTTSTTSDDATKFTSLASKKPSLVGYNSVYEEDDEDADKFLEITLSDPSKIGEGMGSYMVYKLHTKTNIPAFKGKEFSTTRRFSDFLNLFEKLKEKHLPAGRILPPAPEKDMIGMAKVKMSKEDSTSPVDFLDRRKHSLQRFMTRLAKHKTFRYDPDFRDFLEISEELPKANNTSALSGAGMMKIFKNVTDSVSKISIKMEETDQWFEEKSRQVENLYVQYKKMHNAVETMYGWRKDLATSTKDFSKHAAILANSEEQVSLSRALSQLGEIYEKVDQIYVEQANTDFFVFSELVRDYVALFDHIREVFYQRIKTYHNWKKLEETLKTKQDQKAKLEASNKLDKVPTVAAEIRDLEGKVEKGKDDFEQISKTIKEEIKRFDFERAKEFRRELLSYLNTLLTNQETVVKIWEQFLPEVKAI